MLRVEITDPHNQTDTNDYLIESKRPGTYPERIGLKTLTALNCTSTNGKFRSLFSSNNKSLYCLLIELCDDFPVGTYNVTAQLCNGECGSHHPHSEIYDVGKSSFTVTKKRNKIM